MSTEEIAAKGKKRAWTQALTFEAHPWTRVAFVDDPTAGLDPFARYLDLSKRMTVVVVWLGARNIRKVTG